MIESLAERDRKPGLNLSKRDKKSLRERETESLTVNVPCSRACPKAVESSQSSSAIHGVRHGGKKVPLKRWPAAARARDSKHTNEVPRRKGYRARHAGLSSHRPDSTSMQLPPWAQQRTSQLT
jgi:hypothetical protein